MPSTGASTAKRHTTSTVSSSWAPARPTRENMESTTGRMAATTTATGTRTRPKKTALHHEVVEAKTAYLNTRGWTIRAIVYFLIWSLIALAYYRWSRRQDEDHDPEHTLRMQSLAAPCLILFAGTLTFAGFDWLMSLEAAWFSTIFGVVLFAGSAVAILALCILIGLSLYKRGLVGETLNVVHFHDLAKLLFWLHLFLDLRLFFAMDVDLVRGDPPKKPRGFTSAGKAAGSSCHTC